MSLTVFLKRLRSRLRDPRQFKVPKMARLCPICGYEGTFLALGTPARWDGRCPNCDSRERDRLIYLFLSARAINLTDGRSILHFAPERYMVKAQAGNPNYHTADLVPGKARHRVDICNIAFRDASFDHVIANQVLEHVPDDHKALREIARVLKPGGFAILTVPQNWAREETYENSAAKTRAERFAHYGDQYHVRYYGRDFPERIAMAGLRPECFRLPPEEEPRYGLGRSEVLWLAHKD
jgi:SAM-dependent methyltransferase